MALAIQSVIEDAVRAALPLVPTQKIDVGSLEDHNEEEALFVAIEVPPATPRVGGEKLLSAITGVNDALRAAGERRFAYVHVRYLDDEAADEGDPARVAGP